MQTKEPGGASTGDHLNSAMAQLAKLGKKPPPKAPIGDNKLQCPEGAEYLWLWFLELHYNRKLDGTVPCVPIEWDAMWFWKDLNGYTVYPWEVRALKKLDVRYVQITLKKVEDGRRNPRSS